MSNAAKKIPLLQEGNFDLKIQDSQRLFDELQKDCLGFTLLSTYLKNIAGIFLPQNSKNLCLMASRLNSIMKNLNLTKYKDYHKLLQNGDRSLNQEFINALTTNTTQFFREEAHFTLLGKIIPTLLEKKRKEFSDEIRVWCAASSTGQEPYSIAMTLMEKIPDHHKWTVSMLATDIDDEVLSRAKNGIYSENELNSLKENLRKKYFKNTKTNEYQAASALRSMVTFNNFNLLTGNYSFNQKFDIIFCRNVLIYFDAETQKQVVEKLITCLQPDGYLFLGHSESGAIKSNLTNVIAHAAYQRKR